MSRFDVILVIDDSEGDQLLAELAVDRYNPDATLLRAMDGEEALQILRDGGVGPDLILLDVNMPRMDGLAFLAAYTAEVDPPPIVVMLTSSDQAADRERALAFPCVVDYRLKPLEPEDLSDLEEVVDHA